MKLVDVHLWGSKPEESLVTCTMFCGTLILEFTMQSTKETGSLTCCKQIEKVMHNQPENLVNYCSVPSDV